MQKEIEAKFFIDDKNFLRSKLEKIGLKLISGEHLMKRKCFHSLDKNDKSWIRVRNEGNKITMTYKNIVGNTINDVQEIEIIVNNFENACELLSKTNYFEVSYQETLREIWRNNEVEIVIDTWPYLQNYIEIEAKSEELVKKYAKLLDFDFEQEAYFGGVDILYNKQFNIPKKIVNEELPIITFNNKDLEKKLNSYK